MSQLREHNDHQLSDRERSDRERSGRAERLWWMREARFGLFVHWGLYSVAARHEWVKQRERLDEKHGQGRAGVARLPPGPFRASE